MQISTRKRCSNSVRGLGLNWQIRTRTRIRARTDGQTGTQASEAATDVASSHNAIYGPSFIFIFITVMI